jgi:superfamily I DNA/RNA helicase
VWKAIEAFTALLYADDVMTYTQAAAEATSLLTTQDHPYRYVVVDEAQDMHAAHWRLLRALAAPATDDLFIVGDAHQRIYGRPLVLSRYGIETRGRSRRLTVNYRTSRQILDWCSSVMLGTVVDDLEGGSDDLVGARSLFAGPAVETYPDRHEAARVLEVVSTWHHEGLDWGEIAVVVPTRDLAVRLVGALGDTGVPARHQGRDSLDDSANEVHVMTMHRAKGLEFRGVVIAGIGATTFPPKWARDSDVPRFRNLLYVAGSRARELLALVWSGKLTALVHG